LIRFQTFSKWKSCIEVTCHKRAEMPDFNTAVSINNVACVVVMGRLLGIWPSAAFAAGFIVIALDLAVTGITRSDVGVLNR